MALLKVMNVGQFPNITSQASPDGLLPTDCDKIPRDRILDRYNCENEAFRRKFEPEPSRHGVTPPLPWTPNFLPRQTFPGEPLQAVPYPTGESPPQGGSPFRIMYPRPEQATPPAASEAAPSLPIEARLPSDMRYSTEDVLSKAYKAYIDAFREGKRGAITAAFDDYKDAYDAYNRETVLANELETIAYEAGHDTTDGLPGGAERYRSRQADRIAKMESLWPGWYKSYLEWGIYSVTGNQPEWYLKLKSGAYSALDIALQVIPFLPYAKGGVQAVRPFAPAWRSPVQLPMRPGVMTPGRPTIQAPAVQTAPGGQWWENRLKERPILHEPARPLPSKTIWQRYNQQLQYPQGAPAVPSIDTRSMPSSMQPSPQPAPTSIAPPVETQSAGGGQCPPGQFPDGSGGCRSSVSSMPGIPGGIPTGSPAGGIPFAMTGYYRVVNL